MARPYKGRKRTWRLKLDDSTILEVRAPEGATEKQIRRRGRVSLVLGAIVAAVAFAAVAYADNLDDALAAGSVTNPTINEAASFSTTINYQVQKTGSNNTSFPATVNFALSGAPSWVSLNVSSRSFSGYSDVQSVTVSGTAPSGSGGATYNFTVEPSTSAGNLNANPAKVDMSVTVNAQAPSDTTAPNISYVLSPASADGNNGWYVSDVTLTWTVTENESPGSLVKTGCNDQNITADQGEATYSCSATSDGGSAGPVEVKIKRDATDPTVALVGGPADAGSYYFGFVPAVPTCTASDTLSGVDGACSVSGYGTTVGSHSVTASASDMAGNAASDSHSYTVLAWTLNGFLQPVDMGATVWNTVKGGSTVPLKFKLFAGTTELTDTAYVDSFAAKPVTCPNGDVTVDEIEVTVAGGTSLRYDATSGQFIYNWQTAKKPGTCYEVTMKTDDGSTLKANFKLK